ncbi:MAG: CoA ester lyase [Pseudomonadota bacterium]|nr:CoA ester lyase [Pseudomonadota bacterium]
MINHKVSKALRRSALYMPATNQRAMTKAQSLPADVIIFDLEDAVAPCDKGLARQTLCEQLAHANYGPRELVLRINAVDSEWYHEDIKYLPELLSTLPPNLYLSSIAVPKVGAANDVLAVRHALDSANLDHLSLWPMIETPAGVMNVRAIVQANESINCLVMGTSDLAKELRLGDDDQRLGLLFSLSQCVLAARECGVDILDGVCLNLNNQALLAQQVEQGRSLGFTGKTVIHPNQLSITNSIFGVNPEALAEAKDILQAWQKAEQNGEGLAVVNGKLIESLHIEEAQRLIINHDEIKSRGF